MSYDLMRLFDDKIVKAPFGYLGSKYRALEHILPVLPYKTKYIEPFGGSGAVLLARKPSKLEVYNDRFGGVVAVYRCLKDSRLMSDLSSWLESTIYSRELFLEYMQTWKNVEDPVERAGKWLYINCYSVNNKCSAFGRVLNSNRLASCRDIKTKFIPIHERLKHVLIENIDYRKLMEDYDSPETVMYLDPPYLDKQNFDYVHTFTHDDHRELLEIIKHSKSFIAVSGYTNPLYDSYSWDDKIEYSVLNLLSTVSPHITRGRNKEVLWIKYER